MGQMIIRDHAIWAKHIEGDSHIVERLMRLSQNEPIVLKIDGKPVRFLKMRNGADGRPTPGIRPDETFKDFWNALYRKRRGETVLVSLNDTPLADPYLASTSTLMSEWDSPQDHEAYDGL